MSTVTRAASRRMGGAADQAVRPYEVAIAATSADRAAAAWEGAGSAPITTPRRGCGQGVALVAASSPMTRQ